jgi:membrane protein CcdC involved in cytochrome C biogenesis
MPSISNFIGRFISFISIVLMGIGFFMLIKTIKKSNRVRASSLLLSVVFSVAMLLFNVFVMRSARIQWWFPLILIFGAGFGFAWGTTTTLNIQEEKILGKRSVLYIYFWLASMLITQVLAFFAKTNAVAFGLAGMFFSTGASLGTNSNILYRMKHLFASSQEASNINRGIPKKTENC